MRVLQRYYWQKNEDRDESDRNWYYSQENEDWDIRALEELAF
jgi:hypothetical protein